MYICGHYIAHESIQINFSVLLGRIKNTCHVHEAPRHCCFCYCLLLKGLVKGNMLLLYRDTSYNEKELAGHWNPVLSLFHNRNNI